MFGFKKKQQGMKFKFVLIGAKKSKFVLIGAKILAYKILIDKMQTYGHPPKKTGLQLIWN